ncbi:MAG: hypothetical protein JNN28_15285, partial [Saprospiraceae bacterium]|nr:hypothetical protein [Saprospiraceae bacterium]
MKSFLGLVLFCCTGWVLSAQDNANNYQLKVKKAIGAIQLDGALSEPSWQTGSEKADHFKLCFPNDTAYSKWPTEVRITFDDRNLYVGAVCWEQRSDYTVQSMRRDFGGGTTDVFNILLEPNKDGQNGFIFSVSPLNVQREGLI